VAQPLGSDLIVPIRLDPDGWHYTEVITKGNRVERLLVSGSDCRDLISCQRSQAISAKNVLPVLFPIGSSATMQLTWNRPDLAMDAYAKRKRIALVIAHLGPGGAQKVVATAANAFAERGIETHVFTVLDDHADAYDLDPRVCRHRRKGPRELAEALGQERSGKVGVLWQHLRPIVPEVVRRPLGVAASGVDLARRAQWLRRSIRGIKPEAVLSFLTQTNIITILATRGLAGRTIVSERNDPRLQHHRRRVLLMRKLTYPWADLVTANTHGALAAIEGFVPRSKLAFLPNPLKVNDHCPPMNFASPTFITVTRLVEQKGLDVLLKAASRAFASLPDWRLAIVGDGPLRDELKSLAYKLGIGARVDWFGYVDEPMAYLRAAKIFVLTSRFEGSPNALLEAMACGLPQIISDASPGPIELVGDQAGLIVPVEDVSATAEAMIKLGQGEALRARLGTAALERTRMHQLDNAMQIWLELLCV
jgi:glycosyltransferase involved in cell wall biosynthesis